MKYNMVLLPESQNMNSAAESQRSVLQLASFFPHQLKKQKNLSFPNPEIPGSGQRCRTEKSVNFYLQGLIGH